MFDYNPLAEYESKQIPGAIFHLRKMSNGRRRQLNHQAAQVFSDVQQLQREIDVVDKELTRAEDAAKLEPCSCSHPADLHDEKTKRCMEDGCRCREPQPDPAVATYELENKLKDKFWALMYGTLFPIYIQWGVEKIDGYSIRGVPATVESLLADGDEAITNEIGSVIQDLINTSPEKLRDFKWPTTSGAQVGGQTNDTTAPTADGSSGSSSAIAASSTQS